MHISRPFSTETGFRGPSVRLGAPVETGEWVILELPGSVTRTLWSMTGCPGSTGSVNIPRATCFSTMSSHLSGQTIPGHRIGYGFHSRIRRKDVHFGCHELLHRYTVPEFGRNLYWGPPLPPRKKFFVAGIGTTAINDMPLATPLFGDCANKGICPFLPTSPPLSRGEVPFRGGIKNRANRLVQLSRQESCQRYGGFQADNERQSRNVTECHELSRLVMKCRELLDSRKRRFQAHSRQLSRNVKKRANTLDRNVQPVKGKKIRPVFSPG